MFYDMVEQSRQAYLLGRVVVSDVLEKINVKITRIVTKPSSYIGLICCGENRIDLKIT